MLILEENDIVVVPEQEQPKEELVNPASQLISSLVKDEWEAVDGYNSAIATLEQFEGTEHLREVLAEIKGEEFVHIGQLENLLTLVAPEANKIAEGPAENEEMVNEVPDAAIPAEEVEVNG